MIEPKFACNYCYNVLFYGMMFCQDWTCTQLLHVYQEQLITGTEAYHSDGAFIDLRNLQSFEEKFYLVVLEKSADGLSFLHMWEIIISSLQTGKLTYEF